MQQIRQQSARSNRMQVRFRAAVARFIFLPNQDVAFPATLEHMYGKRAAGPI
jgi:hypothetical protein